MAKSGLTQFWVSTRAMLVFKHRVSAVNAFRDHIEEVVGGIVMLIDHMSVSLRRSRTLPLAPLDEAGELFGEREVSFSWANRNGGGVNHIPSCLLGPSLQRCMSRGLPRYACRGYARRGSSCHTRGICSYACSGSATRILHRC